MSVIHIVDVEVEKNFKSGELSVCHINYSYLHFTIACVSTKDLQLFLDVLTGQVRALDVRKTRGH